MITTEIIDTLAALEALEAAWGDLNRKSGVDEIYFSFAWFAAWWKVFGGKRHLCVLVVRNDDRILGIAPLMASDIRKYGRTRKILELIGWPDAGNYGFIGSDPALVIREAVGFLSKNSYDWDRMELHQISWNGLSGPGDVLREIRRPFRLRTRETPVYQEFLPPVPDSDDPLAPAVTAAARTFSPDSPLSLDRLTEIKDIESNMPVLFHLHLNDKRSGPGPSHFSESSQRRFLNELVKRLAPGKRINLVRLKSGEVPVAYGFNVITGDRVDVLETAVNPLFSGRSADKLFMLMQTAMFSNQGFKVGFSNRLPASGGFPPREMGITHDITICQKRFDYFSSSVRSTLLEFGPIRRALHSQGLRSLKGKVNLTFHREGLKTVLTRSLSKVFHLVGGLATTYYIYRYDGGAPRMTHLKVDIDIRKFGLAELDRIATFYGVGAGNPKLETFRQRFEKNADCYVALHHGSIVSTVWGLFHEDHFRQHGVSLKPGCDEVVISDALTSPIYRSMGIAPYLLGTMVAEYNQRGLRAIAGVHKNNMPSRRGLEAYNFKHVRTDRVFRIFGIRLI